MRPVRRLLLIVGGLYHDFDFVRLQLLSHLSRYEHIRVDLRHDYADIAALDRCDALITYTSALLPDADQTRALTRWVEQGGRWFALHGTNSAIAIQPDGQVKTPPMDPALFDLLGSQFLAHPVPGQYRIRPVTTHPLIHGIGAFFLDDEHYLQRHATGNHVLLASQFEGTTSLFETRHWDMQTHQSCYLRPRGDGCVLYLTPGHARGRYDMQPLTDAYPFVERGAWGLPVFNRLIQHGIDWLDRDPAKDMP